MNLLNTRTARTLAGGVLVAALAVALTGLVHKRPVPPKPGDVPAYRQKGPSSARVTITVYSDFECPFCRRGAQAVQGLTQRYPHDLHVVFRHKPLMMMHPYARLAAQAAECAGLQGKFWEFHDALFSHQDDWARPPDAMKQVVALAKGAGLDMTAFDACFKSPATSALVEADLKDADARGVNATPTFLIGDQRYVGDKQLLTLGAAEIKKRLGS
jgi:protein-disulfide isomerase